ncbi:MAG: TlpA family protein disulfide reductase [bacterium]|nr:TlpA family protein disulfide reductase [bacterium]
MRTRNRSAILLTLWLFGCAAAWGSPTLRAPTETEEFLAPDMPLPVMDWEAYRAQAERRRHNATFVAISNERDAFAGDAWFAILPLGGPLVGAALEPTNRVCRIDRNANGDLLDDDALPLRRQGDEWLVDLRYERRVERDAAVLDVPTPMRIHWRVGDAELRVAQGTLRTGTLRIGDDSMLFGLRGYGGEYDRIGNEVLFDLDGNGQLDLLSPTARERFREDAAHVNLFGESYAFTVDPLGRELTLRPLEQKQPDRQHYEVGARAPAVQFVDIDGNTRRLADYRGKIVLLEFWGTWCKPCVEEAPAMVEIYRTHHERGFEILGFHSSGSVEIVREFIARLGMTWPQTMRRDEEHVFKLFRVQNFPTNVLIDRDGTVLDGAVHIEDLAQTLDELLGP